MTARQARFCLEYIVDLNGEQAAIRAGYSARTAKSQASRLLTKANLRGEIDHLRVARSERTEITADRALAELGCMGLYDPGDIVRHVVTEPAHILLLPEHVRRAIVGWSWDQNNNFVLKLAPKTPSLIEIGRHLGIAQRHELTGKDGEPLAAAADPSKIALLILNMLQAARPPESGPA